MYQGAKCFSPGEISQSALLGTGYSTQPVSDLDKCSILTLLWTLNLCVTKICSISAVVV